jgi:hypothetical protein
MRDDCTIDNRAVIARNATLLGFATNRIKAGTYFVYKAADGSNRMGRSLGRVSAPALCETPRIEGYVLAMVWFEMGYCCERWINPDEIIEAYSEPPTKLAELFFAPKLPYDAQTMRQLMAYGTLSESYVGNAERNAKAFQSAALVGRPPIEGEWLNGDEQRQG